MLHAIQFNSGEGTRFSSSAYSSAWGRDICAERGLVSLKAQTDDVIEETKGMNVELALMLLALVL